MLSAAGKIHNEFFFVSEDAFNMRKTEISQDISQRLAEIEKMEHPG